MSKALKVDHTNTVPPANVFLSFFTQGIMFSFLGLRKDPKKSPPEKEAEGGFVLIGEKHNLVSFSFGSLAFKSPLCSRSTILVCTCSIKTAGVVGL